MVGRLWPGLLACTETEAVYVADRKPVHRRAWLASGPVVEARGSGADGGEGSGVERGEESGSSRGKRKKGPLAGSEDGKKAEKMEEEEEMGSDEKTKPRKKRKGKISERGA